VRYLFSAAARGVLKQLAPATTLCAFDFDGTLAPIVERPDEAGISEETRELLTRLAEAYPCMVVSGRARADVLEKLAGVPLARVYGNHGAEGMEGHGVERARVERWKAALENEIAAMAGVWVEDKTYSLAVHYRQARLKGSVRRQVVAAAEKIEDARVIGGKQVVNLVGREASNKGDAVDAERRRLGCAWVLFVGDDDNDEDAFGLTGNVVAVRVGKKRRSKAGYYLKAQYEMNRLLEMLVSLRAEAAVGCRVALR
jgi:trehalose 6-phosphate phosphatase